MKILLMVPRVHQGGQERICILTARLLQEKHEVTLLIFDDTDCVYDLSGLSLVNIHSKADPNPVKKLWNVVERVKKVKRVKRQGKFDLCYSFGATANLINVLSGQGEKIWTGIRGYDDLDDTRRTGLFCKKSDKVVCCARVMEDDLVARYTPKSVTAIYNPCDLEEIARKQEEPFPEENGIRERDEAFYRDAKVIVSMGRDAHLKGFWHLLKAFSLVSKKVPEAKLLILGRGEYQKCKELAKGLGIEDKVYFAGVRSNPFPYLKRAALYVLSSQDGEGFPNALAEAMACGVPVVATNCKSGPAEILCEEYQKVSDRSLAYEVDYGILLPIGQDAENYDEKHIEPEERVMAEKLTELLCQPDKAKDYRERAKKRAQDFSNAAYMKNLEKWLE